ncbi:unnamed protein product [Dicrocoelium dendriticum]|nr:unnamed protein product [Dicrocoelium dendriticum]
MLAQTFQEATESGPGTSTAPCSGLTADTFPVISSTFSQNDIPIREKPHLPCSTRLAPLSGKKIFMHYDPGTLPDRRVEMILAKLKADVVDFFSREVHYVITSRHPSRIPGNAAKLSPRSEEVVHLNPRSGHPRDTSTTIASSVKMVPSAFTRGRAMLMAARKVSPNANSVHASPPESSPLSTFHQMRLKNTSSQSSTPGRTVSHSIKGENTAPMSSNDLLVRARHLGIRILTLDCKRKPLRIPPSSEQNDVDENSPTIPDDPERDRIYQVRHLSAPCIKIVDLTNQFRPLYLDRTDFLPNLWSTFVHPPRIKDTTLVEHSPAQTACGSGTLPGASMGLTCIQQPSHPMTRTQSVLSRRSNHTKKRERKCKKPSITKNTPTLRRSVSIPIKLGCAIDRSKTAIEEPSGYCECCSLSFSNLLEHLKSVEHQQFACNIENYRPLDRIFSQLPSIEIFLTSDAHRKRRSCVSRRKKRHQSYLKEPNDVNVTQNCPPDVPLPRIIVSSTDNHILPSSTVDGHPLVATEATDSHCPPFLHLPESLQAISGARIVDQEQLFSDEEEEIGLIRESLLHLVDRSNLASSLAPVAVLDPTFAAEPHPGPCQSAVATSSADTEMPLDTPALLPSSYTCPIAPCPTPDPEVAHAWHSLCNRVYVDKLLTEPRCDIPDNSSPLLERCHRPCLVCHRLHIPTSLSPSLYLQLNSLLGPRYELDGVGCLGRQSHLPHSTLTPSSAHSSETDSHAVHTHVVPVDRRFSNSASSSLRNSPVFGTNPSELCIPHDATLSTLPMSQDLSSLQAVEADCIPDTRDKLSPLHGDTVSRVSSDNPEPIEQPFNQSSDSLLSTSLQISEPNFVGSNSPTVRSDITPIRRSLSWMYNSNSFDAKLPPTDKSADSSVSPSAVSTVSQLTNKTRKHWCSEGITAGSLPIVKHPKHSSSSTSFVSHSSARAHPFHMKHARCQNRKRHRNGAPTSFPVSHPNPPQRSPRLAAQIARESINLSVRTIFYPSTMNSFSTSPENAHTPSLSPLKRISVNSSHSKPGKSAHRSPLKSRPHKRVKRCTLFPTPAFPTLAVNKSLTS